jgi:uncharacterized membrane protein YphA (DoxX/SURF4 family)
MNSLWLIRVAIALVWLYQGLWCKLLGRMPHHEAVIESVPFLDAAQAHLALLGIGGLEVVVAVWVLCGRWAFGAALAQTVLLAIINAGGVFWASAIIPDPLGMLFQNFAFVLLVWIAAREIPPYAAHA